MAPVMSSVTVACCVRSPSATVCSSFISRRMAAWLASLTRLASCSWRSASRRCALRQRLRACAARRVQLHEAERRPSDDERARDEQPAATQRRRRRGRSAPTSLSCTSSSALAQRLAVGDDRGLRFARGHQALQVAQDGAGLRAGLLRTASAARPGARGSAGPCVPARRSSGLPSSRPCAISLKEFRSLPSRNTASGLTPSIGQEFVGRLADALRQHHQLAGRRDLGRRRVLLQLQRRHRLGDLQQVGRLAVDGAQRGADLRQDLLLRQHGAGVLLGALDQRQRPCRASSWHVGRRGRRRSAVVAGLQAAHRRAPARRRFPSPRGRPAGCRPAPATPTWRGAATASAPGRWPPPAARPCRPAATRRTASTTSAEQRRRRAARAGCAAARQRRSPISGSGAERRGAASDAARRVGDPTSASS